ncbi:MAG: PH domain-containing protein [Solobacterium sp.]|nr:PH domain-containing protein [Solobacterium sp.]
MAQTELFKWSLNKLADPSQTVLKELANGETIRYCYANGSDYAVITDKRFFAIDRTGLTGMRSSVFSLPFRSVVHWTFSGDPTAAEARLTTREGVVVLAVSALCGIENTKKALTDSILNA